MTPHCVIIEWGDGTVQANGPYDGLDKANRGAHTIAHRIAEDQDLPLHKSADLSWTLGDDGSDQIDVYVQPMSEPVL